MNYGEIKKTDIANGDGVRVTLFVSGCTHHCKDCFNKETWDFTYGKPFTESVKRELLDALAPAYIKGLTILGGEPFEKINQKGLLPFLRKVRNQLPEKTIWCYSGYTFDVDMVKGGKVYCDYTDEMLSLIDVLVDGEFVKELKDIRLDFRGSSNQRIIDLNASRKEGKLVFLERRNGYDR